ncbi:acyltransferase-domain-containing protein [Ascobolus immersus RN42]|uniref:Acyltransferase-domain-containing protein n=1 Tax=Ascobolus immersus RN42 TaxID=1160509 RepID=A0A3N4IEL4_ASCIM|nr:acyltransferase-domain-containing protein [Ascobolus immersus RN42]
MVAELGETTPRDEKPLNETEAPKFGKEDLFAAQGDVSAGRPAKRFGRVWSTVRMVSFCAYFLTGCILIVLTQLIGAPLYFVNKPLFYAWMARTKHHFGILVTTITQWWAPTVIRVTGDRSVRHQLKRAKDGRLECDFPERMVLIANHQIYSDWLYLWWIAYTSSLAGHLYIILKESLRLVPILGFPGMMFYGFIFLARNWAKDQGRFAYRLNKLTKSNDPMWLLIFPEGTNASDNGRRNSAKYAAKIGVNDFRHVLLPRSTGLRFCLETLGNAKSVEWMYDCTVAYEGVPRGEFGQDLFTLSSMYFSGQPPKSVNMHWRRFRISEIPYSSTTDFEVWLRERWQEKDDLMEHYLVNGFFPEDVDETDKIEDSGIETDKDDGSRVRHRTKMVGGRKRTMKVGGGQVGSEWQGVIETEVALKHWWECFDVVKVVATVAMLWRLGGRWWTIVKGVGEKVGS